MALQDRNEKIITLYESGMLIKDIAKEVGMAPNSVGVILKRLGVDRPSKPQKKLVEIDGDKVKTLYESGLSTSAIAERLSVTERMIADNLRSQGVKLDGRRRRYDGEGGTITKGGALQRIARRA